jgi:cyclopropane-fatty-acyl-phospholipid synthase
MKVPDSTLPSFSQKYWSQKTDGMHRHSKEEWFDKYSSELLAMLPCGGTLLDVGCGSCQVTTYLASKYEQVLAVDFSETMLMAGRQRTERLGITNVRLLSGTAQRFPQAISRADVILSYGVLQYLTLSDLVQHLHECRRVLTRDGMVCAALIPNVALREIYYKGKLAPSQGHLRGQLKSWIALTRRRVKGFLEKDFLWDGIGNWFSQADIEQAAKEAGFEVEFRNSWFYEYRFHALLRLKNASANDGQ